MNIQCVGLTGPLDTSIIAVEHHEYAREIAV
jgi:hypothetical protein